LVSKCQDQLDPRGLTTIINNTSLFYNFTYPFVSVPCTVTTNNVYLNRLASYYSINISINNLGSAYIPNNTDPINGIGSWYIENIFAGSYDGKNVIPINTFSMAQRPVILFIQNIGGVPINIVFASNDSPTSLNYFSFGVPPNATPSSYTLDPLSILVLQVIFTSNNVIRFYNNFIDVLNYNQLFRTFDQALTFGYYQDTATLSSATIGSSDIPNILEVVAPSIIHLKDIIPYFCENNILFLGSNLELIVDGTGLPDNAVLLLLLLVFPGSSSKIVLKNLVGIKNYLGQSVPTQLLSSQVWFMLIKGRTVTAYDKHCEALEYKKVKPTNIGLELL